MILSQDELAAITGYRRPSAQMRWLKANRWPFAVGGDGLPKVLKTVAEAKLGGITTSTEPRLRLA